jgi:transcriptional regulator with XRE-family HTH domain
LSRRKRPQGFKLEPTYLLEWRKSRDMTLEDVGKKMGIDKTAISRIERGLTPYDQIHLQQMHKIYEVAIPDLLFTDPKRPKGTAEPVKNAELVELVKKLERKADIEAVTTRVEAMLARG